LRLPTVAGGRLWYGLASFFCLHAMTPPPDAQGADPAIDQPLVVQDTVRWMERAVIGLNLCPFAKGVHARGLIHYAVSGATEGEQLLQDLERELRALAAMPPAERDTTLLIAPACFPDFLDFNDFLDAVDGLVDALDLGGTLQVASFHPRFQFVGTAEDDVTNCTNRAPYPTLHLLREDSIAQAVEAFPQAQTIYERNMQVLQDLGEPGWKALDVAARCPVPPGTGPQEPKA